VKAWELLGETSAPDGTDIRLTRRGDEYLILANGRPLMSSRLHGSEEALATLGCDAARRLTSPRVLVGGLGMGFTLRAVLDVLPAAAVVHVAELLPAVVQWNRESLGALAGHPLRDRRVRVEVADVGFTLRGNRERFDAVLLDVDNGPAAFTAGANAGLYDNGGVAAAHAALCTGGTLAIWSAWEDTKFEQRLRFHGFAVETIRVRARLKKGGPRHIIFLARKAPRMA
jgi:spermidine synthase